MAVTGNVSASIALSNNAVSDNESAAVTISLSGGVGFTDGVGAGQLNKIWQDTRTVADGAGDTLDLNPTPTSGLSGIVTFAAVKALMITAAPGNTTNFTVTGTLLAKPPAILKPGAVYVFTDPSAAGSVVTAGSADTIIMTNSAGAAASYSIAVGGI